MRAQESFNALKIDITNHFNRSIQLGFQPSPAMIKQWGINIGYNDKNALSVYFYSQDMWVYRIMKAMESADQLLVQLNSLPPSAAGAQLLRLFFIDMLGTDTPEAKIFGNKSGVFFNDTNVSLLLLLFVILSFYTHIILYYIMFVYRL